jgi:hypothetical protein
MITIENWDSVEVKEVRFIENDGGKLSRQLLSLVDFSRGNNYYSDVIRVAILSNSCIRVSTFCVNDYGRRISNENHTTVAKADIPFFTLKKLGLV